MKRIGSRLLCILLLLSLLLSLTACGKPETQLEKTACYLQAQVAEPGAGSIGGDWLIFGRKGFAEILRYLLQKCRSSSPREKRNTQ